MTKSVCPQDQTIAQLQSELDELKVTKEQLTKREQQLNKKIDRQRESLKEWQKNSKQVYKELKRNEIMREKERYEMLVSIKQLKAKVEDQGKVIKTYQKEIQKFKQKQNTEQEK